MLRKVARSLVATAGAAGALAFVNGRLRGGLPINHLAGNQHRWAWRRSEIFAVEAGEGTTIILMHAPGLCGSSYEYRRLFGLLAQRHHVVAFDFLGSGLSDKPSIDYSAELFVEQTIDALRQFGTHGAVLVGSSLAAAYAIRVAARAGGLIQGVVAIVPSSTRTTAMRIAPVLAVPLIGQSAFNALISKRALKKYLTQVLYGDSASVTQDVLEAYYAVAHQPGSRQVAAAFFEGRLDCDVAQDLPFVEVPLLILWGKRSKTDPARNAEEYAALAKQASIEYYVRSALLPHDEEAEAVAKRIEDYVRSLNL